jgi:hypothetical protein
MKLYFFYFQFFWLGMSFVPSFAQIYPHKPIRMIIPAAAGGGVDTIGRFIGVKLSESFQQAVIPDNRPGAGTMIGSELTAKAAPDGYTFLMVTNSHAINASSQKNFKFDPVKDFLPVSLVVISPFVLVVHPSVTAKNVTELIELARQRPGELHFASAGNISATHLAGELFKHLAGIKLVHVPYKGGSPAVADLLGGHVQILFDNLISVLPLTKSGRLKALGVTSSQRLNALPEMPTIAESGLPGYESGSWYGVLLPALTPRSVVNTLHREVVKAINVPEFRSKMNMAGTEIVGNTPEQFERFFKQDIEKWGQLIPILKLQ